MGWWDDWFGEWSTGAKDPKVRQKELGTAEQKALRENYFNMLMGMKPATAYGDEFITPTTPQELTGLEKLSEYLGRERPEYFGDVESAMTRLLSGESPYEVDPAATSEYFETYVKPQAMRTYKEDLLPAMRESFAGGGRFWATPRLEAEKGLAGDVSESLTSERGKLAMQDILAEREGKTIGAQLQAGTLPQATAISSLLEEGGLRRAAAAQKYGYLPREDERLQHEYADWLRVQEDPYRRAGLMQQALGLETTQPYWTPQRRGWLGEVFDFAGGVLGSYSGSKGGKKS